MRQIVLSGIIILLASSVFAGDDSVREEALGAVAERMDSLMGSGTGVMNADRLREKYPDSSKFIIVRGAVGTASRHGPNAGKPVAGVRDTSISVTSEFRSQMTEFRREAQERPVGPRARDPEKPVCKPTHNLIVKWGQRYEPWLAEVVPLPAS